MSEPTPQPPRHALDWAAGDGRAEWLLAELRARAARRRRRRTLGLVATAVLALGAFWLVESRPLERLPQSRPALVHQPIRQVLADGSTIELREGAQLAVDFSTAWRRVRLTQGEAHFSVAKDPARPFVVTAGGAEVRAVGTEFVVQFAPGQIAVLVTEGRVALGRPAGTAPAAEPLALVGAGTRAVLETPAATDSSPAPAPRVTALAPSEIAEHLAWRIPRLEFSGTRLDAAVALFNRHSRRHLQLADPGLGDLQVSGIVRADNVEALLQLLEANYHLVARDAGPAGLVLERRP
jgi:transmembrane sensor